MRKLLLLLFSIIAVSLFAQDYNVVMPGQQKVTVTDEQGNTTTQVVTDTESDLIYYKGDYYMHKGQKLTEEEFVAKMKAECTPAYEKFMRSGRVKKAGLTMAIVGGVTMVAGAGFLIGGAVHADHINYYNSSSWYIGSEMVPNWAMFTGLPLMIAGGGIFIGGMVVILQTAPDCKRKAHQVYNSQCARKEQANNYELRLQTSSNGIGLAFAW